MNSKILRLVVLMVVSLLLASGCVVQFITPRTEALREVHETYRQEFIAFNVPAPADKAELSGPSDAFIKTLQAIRDYRLKYPGDMQELAHLQVLEGMIYLQSGRFGLAQAVKEQVTEAGARLTSASGRTVRDKLFAENFPLLVEGWAETRKSKNKQWQTFERAAAGLRTSLANSTDRRLASPDADHGAVYLATTAAIFDTWAFAWWEVAQANATPADIEVKRREIYSRARDVIGRFLTDAEKAPSTREDMTQVLEGRLRYVQWYHWLDENQ
jgi:hypothetical protein